MKCVLVPTNESTMHSTSHRFPRGNVQHPHTCFHQTIMRDSLSNLMSNTWIAPRFSYSSSPFCMTSSITRGLSLQWRHNEPDGISNHQHRDCLLNCLFRRRSKKTSNPRVTGFCEGNSPVTGEFPSQRACDAEMLLFDDVIMIQNHYWLEKREIQCNYCCWPSTDTCQDICRCSEDHLLVVCIKTDTWGI